MRKLLKYEMRAMNRRLFPVYIGMLAIALLNFFFGIGTLVERDPISEYRLESLPEPLYYIAMMFRTLIIALFFGIMVGMLVVWLLTTINRFRKGLLGEEGYLMFTLPVTTGRLIGAKLIGASIHLVLAGVVALLSFLMMMGPPMLKAFFALDLFGMFRDLSRTLPTWPLIVLEFVLLMVFNVFKSILHFYLAMAIGHLSNRHRTLLSVVSYIGIATVLSMLASLGFTLLSVLEASGILDGFVRAFLNDPQLAAHVVMIAFTLLTVLQCVIFWFPTRYILKNRLNLE